MEYTKPYFEVKYDEQPDIICTSPVDFGGPDNDEDFA